MDIPRVTIARRLLGPFHIYGVFWSWLLITGIGRTPNFLLPIISRVLVTFFFLCLPGIRRSIASNQEAVLGPCGFWQRQRRIWLNLHCYAWCLAERSEDLSTDHKVVPEIEGDEHWTEVLEDGVGFLLVTAHIGHWEVASAYPADLHGRQVHIVRQAEIDDRSQEFLRRKIEERGRGGYKVHFVDPARGKSSVHLGPKLLLALRDGDGVALQGDRPATGGRVIDVELFGRPFSIPVGPAAIARTVEAPLLPVFVYRTGRLRSHVVIRPPIQVVKTRDRDQDLQLIAQQIVGEVEQAIRRDPYQWFCFQELWPKEEKGAADAG